MQHNINFKNEFSKLDDMVHMTPADLASVIAAPTIGSVYAQLHRGDLPVPFIRKNRQLRWTVGQIREHLKNQIDAFKLAQAEQLIATGGMDRRRLGRARKSSLLST